MYTRQRPRRVLPGHRAAVPEGAFDPAGGKLLGAQVLGWDGVDKRIDVLAVALRAGMTVYDLEHLELAYAPPYGAAKNPVNMAGFLGANLLRGDIDLWYPEDYPDCAGKVTILDVRTPAEYDAWHIPGAALLPFTELRQRLDEVPRDKPVYTYCRSGFRSYIAYCVLRQNGWDQVAFLSGGMMTYHGYHRTPLAVGKGGMPMVAYAEDDLAQRPAPLSMSNLVRMLFIRGDEAERHHTSSTVMKAWSAGDVPMQEYPPARHHQAPRRDTNGHLRATKRPGPEWPSPMRSPRALDQDPAL